MKQRHSTAWKASKQPRKQRKYRTNAPLHIKGKFLRAPLVKELSEKHNIRTIRIRKGDKVRIMRGSHKGKEGKVEAINTKESLVYVHKVETVKKDGATKVPLGLDASNLMIVELDASDKLRLER